MGICPTLKQLLELEVELFSRTQDARSMPPEAFTKAEAEWNRAFEKAKALGGPDLILYDEA